jgi:F0F1-type ATP synthase epsilon subunit
MTEPISSPKILVSFPFAGIVEMTPNQLKILAEAGFFKALNDFFEDFCKTVQENMQRVLRHHNEVMKEQHRKHKELASRCLQEDEILSLVRQSRAALVAYELRA